MWIRAKLKGMAVQVFDADTLSSYAVIPDEELKGKFNLCANSLEGLALLYHGSSVECHDKLNRLVEKLKMDIYDV